MGGSAAAPPEEAAPESRAGAAGALWRPSPNHGPRRGDVVPSLVVLHYTAMDTAEAALARLCDPQAEVSAHYLVGREGRLWQLVDERARAWHAGAGAWGGIADVNSASIGIELDNTGRAPFSEPLMTRLEALLAELAGRWGIGPAGVIGHADCAPGRKADPGPRFDWRRLGRRGLAAWPAPWPEPKPEPWLEPWPAPGADPGGALEPLLARAGYTAPAPAAARLAAFRMRFRPGAAGPAEAADRALLAALPPAPRGPERCGTQPRAGH